MATVLQRVEALGLEHDKKLRSKLGIYLSDAFSNEIRSGRIISRGLSDQTENGETFVVWDYCSTWTSRMDELILDFVHNPFTDA